LEQWWRNAVVYQVYVRSFADGNGDGVGDLAGVRSRLGYLRDLGVDALWFTPWYESPLADGGYDVSDYRAIEPTFGTLAEAEALIRDALAVGIKTVIDIVPNHVSDRHPWFVAAIEDGPMSPMRDRFWFRPGQDVGGVEPPNGWTSQFGDAAWSRTQNPDGSKGDWYLHLFAPAQPDLNWNHPAVRAEHEDVLRFWFDRGAAGIRIDSATLAIKDAELPEVTDAAAEHPYVDREEIHDLYRSWRTIADGYDPPRALIGEIWLDDHDRFSRYLRPGELHGAFNFDFLSCAWDPIALRRSVEQTLRVHTPVDAPASWVLSNHDVTRVATRYGRKDTTFSFAAKHVRVPSDLALGQRRARAALLLAAALPGTLYVYQGDELGLPEVEDLAPEHIHDPMHFQSGGTDPGRDGCRVPLPWDGTTPPFGFGPPASSPWIPQPPGWADLTVAAQLADDGSMLALYRRVIRVRRHYLAEEGPPLEWTPSGDGVLSFRRRDVTCVVNLSAEPVTAPPGRVLVASVPVADGQVPPDAAAWIQDRPTADKIPNKEQRT